VGLIRVILAYAVVLNHSRPVHGYFLMPSNAAVTLFFMISGFYMALVLTEKYTGRIAFGDFIPIESCGSTLRILWRSL
jgi:peptidoglycan/LPS O-acetylase OafA/YrhL